MCFPTILVILHCLLFVLLHLFCCFYKKMLSSLICLGKLLFKS